MPSTIGVAGEIVTAAAALSGLILVFLGAVASSYDSYQRQEQQAVRGRYQRRAWFAFVGFALALISLSLALTGKWLTFECATLAALILLGFSLLWVLAAALSSVRGIK